MKRLLAPLLVLLATAAPLGAQTIATTQPYHDAVAGYAVRVPAAWTRLPQEMVDQVMSRMSNRIGTELPPSVGFRGEPGQNGLPGVILIVSASRDAAIREATFATEITGAEAAAATDATMGRVNAARGRRPISVDAPSWDAEAKVAWMAGSSTSAAGNEVRILSAMRPVDRWGMLMVVTISGDGASFEQLRERVLPVVQSLAVDGR